MRPKITYDYDPGTGIFSKIHYGNIVFEDVINSWNEIIGKNAIPDGTSRFILDYINATFLTDDDGTTQLVKFYKAYSHIFSGSKIALIMNKPDQVILPILVDHEVDGIFFKPFCTYEGALEWLKPSSLRQV